MRSFADRRVMENKIPDLFVQADELTQLWDEIVYEHPDLTSQ